MNIFMNVRQSRRSQLIPVSNKKLNKINHRRTNHRRTTQVARRVEMSVPGMRRSAKPTREKQLNMFKLLHRNKCLARLPLIRKHHINEFGDKTNYKETVLIEFRELPHIEFLIRNTILKLNNWNHTIVCGKNNYNMIKHICDDIHKNTSSKIKIIKLDITNIVQSEYSKLLMTTTFWDNFVGEKILIYQEDSMLFHGNIEPFLQFDYCGAPWPNKTVGNGGFSLRTKSIMKLCIEKNTNLKLKLRPEDVFFITVMRENKIGKVCPFEISKRFSQEKVMSINPLGGHAFWKAII